MFHKIVISIVLFLIAYLIFYIVELIKLLMRYLKILLPKISDICSKIQKEQEMIDKLLINPTKFFYSIEGVTRTVDEIVSIGKQVKNLWPRKAGIVNHTNGEHE